MLFAAKSAAPLTSPKAFHLSKLDEAAEGTRTLFTTPPGYLLSDSLVLALTDRGCPIIWLRIGNEDLDPATLLISLIAAAQKVHPGIGSQTLHFMRVHPGPISGWPSLFTSLAREFTESLPVPCAIVLEQIGRLKKEQSTLSLLGIDFLQALPAHIVCILISNEELPNVVLPSQTISRGITDLRVDLQAGLALVKDAGSDLSRDYVSDAIHLVDGRIVLLAGLLSAEKVLGTDYVRKVIKRSKKAEQLLSAIVKAYLSTFDPDRLKSLALAMHLEYSHPSLLEEVLGIKTQMIGPWIQPLSDGWSRIRHVWRTPLYSSLRNEMVSNYSALHQTADYLVEQGALDRAITLYFKLGDTDSAARVIAGIAAQLTNLGQWKTLDLWLKLLPSEIFRDWPWLLYTRGEILTLQGYLPEARKTFAEAASFFSTRYEDEGVCQCLLSESIVAAWQGDMNDARSYALTASAKAEATGLNWFQGWAAWLLGSLNTLSGDLETAMVYFSQASNLIHSPLLTGLIQQVEALALKQHELHLQSELHRQTYLNLQRAEEEAFNQLSSLISSPPKNLPGLLTVYGWWNTPLLLKLSSPKFPNEEDRANEELSPFAGLLRSIELRLRSRKPKSWKNDLDGVSDLEIPFRIMPDFSDHLLSAEVEKQGIGSSFKPNPYVTSLPISSNSPTEDNILSTGQDEVRSAKTFLSGVERNPSFGKLDESLIKLTAYLLGDFMVWINDHKIEKWHSSRGQAVLKYFLANFREEISRDVLMDIFWPDSAPDSARNNLNVALHNLRQVFRPITQKPIIVFERGIYHLNSEITIWIDSDEFERHFQAGRQLESAGQIPDAMNEYEIAINIYHGDFLSNDPYDEWPVITRERLRVMFLEALERLSQMYFSQGQYTTCISLCKQILERDDCREDAHCRLMRCYSRQGQHNLALRQYQTCVEALRTQLDVEPEVTTTQLAERIRLRERV